MNQYGTQHPPVSHLVHAREILHAMGWVLNEEQIIGDYYDNHLHTHDHTTVSNALTLAQINHDICLNPNHLLVHI